MTLAPDIEEALERFAEEEGISRDEALSRLARDWLVGIGYLSASDEESVALGPGGGDVVGNG